MSDAFWSQFICDGAIMAIVIARPHVRNMNELRFNANLLVRRLASECIKNTRLTDLDFSYSACHRKKTAISRSVDISSGSGPDLLSENVTDPTRKMKAGFRKGPTVRESPLDIAILRKRLRD